MKRRSIGFFFFSSRRRHTRLTCDWSSDVALPIFHEFGPCPIHRRSFEAVVPPVRKIGDGLGKGRIHGVSADAVRFRSLCVGGRLEERRVGKEFRWAVEWQRVESKRRGEWGCGARA